MSFRLGVRGHKRVLLPKYSRQLSIKRQSGYAAVLTPILAGVMLLSLFSLYDGGQVASHKMRGQNAADAGAYSVANMVARDMNYIASTNRMMVAHQAATGQFIGLASYSRMLEQSAENLDAVADVASLFGFGAALKPFTQALESFAEGFRQAIDQISRVVVVYNNAVIGVVTEAQEIFHLAMFAVAPMVYEDVVKANDEDIAISNIISAASAVQFVQDYNRLLKQYKNPGPNDQNSDSGRNKLQRYEEFAEVTIEGADNFTQSRHRANWFWPIRQRGGSEFKRRTINNEYVYDWTAMDTVALNIRLGFFLRIRIPIGWGAAHALNSSDSSSPRFDYISNRYQGYWVDNKYKRYSWGENGGAWYNRNSAYLAAILDDDNNINSGSTIKPFYDLQSDELIDTGPELMSVLQKEASDTRVWRAVAEDLPNYDLQDDLDVAENGGLLNDRMLSVSKGEVYFARAHDLWGFNNGKAELGNMYNPFWQPRLSKITNEERAAILLIEAGLSL